MEILYGYTPSGFVVKFCQDGWMMTRGNFLVCFVVFLSLKIATNLRYFGFFCLGCRIKTNEIRDGGKRVTRTAKLYLDHL